MNRNDKRLRIALVTPLDPMSRQSWSGTIYYMAQALQRHCGDVTLFGPAEVGQITGKIFNRLVRGLFGKRYDYSHGIAYARACARFFERKLAGQAFDIIFAPAASTAIAFLDTDVPIVYASDVTFALMNDYYPEFTNLLARSVRNGNIVEGNAIRKSAAVLCSSDWAAQSAVRDYGADRGRVRVLSFGANMDEIPDRDDVLDRGRSGTCRLLFLSVSWTRKGGDIARETLVKLLQIGVDAELTVCGCVPPAGRYHERMRVVPFLNKNDERQSRELARLVKNSDFLLLPTRFDCTPIVFCEANAYGLPVVTTDTGGISSVIRNGENGFLLPHSAGGDAYAETIAAVFLDGERFASLRHSSRKAYEERLNWDAWAAGVRSVLDEVLCAGSGRKL